MSEFPKIEYICTSCGGSGYEDVSYHGSPVYDDCFRCKGVKNVKYHREMTVDEKLDYLLKVITRM